MEKTAVVLRTHEESIDQSLDKILGFLKENGYIELSEQNREAVGV